MTMRASDLMDTESMDKQCANDVPECAMKDG